MKYSENDDVGLGYNCMGDMFKDWVDQAAAFKAYGAKLAK